MVPKELHARAWGLKRRGQPVSWEETVLAILIERLRMHKMKNITYNQSNIEDSLVFKDYIQNAWKDSWISMKGYNKMDKDASFNLCISFLFHNSSWTFV